MNYPKKYYPYIHISVLLIICLMIFFPNISSYPFIDTDETKFVSIAKDMLNYSDWINIKLNGEDVFGLSPLFFWITNLSCVFFGKINMLSTRLPISIISTIVVLITYIRLRNTLTKTYAFIIALILSTCLGTLIFGRIATNDMMSAAIVIMAILLCYSVIFSKNQRKIPFYWLCIYFLAALSIMSSGLLGFVIIAFSIITMHIFSGNLKEIFKPRNLIPGLILFLILALPWPFIMVYKHKMFFIREYLSAYNFIKYAGIKEYIWVFVFTIFCFLPWSFSFLWILGTKIKDSFISFISYFKDNSQDKLHEKWFKLKKIDKFISLNTIVFFTALFLAILYGSKYTFLILFMVFPTACIAGRYWYEYIIKKQHDRSIFFATIIPNLALIICSLLGLFGHNILNQWISQGFSNLVIPLIVIFFAIPVISIFAVLLKGRIIPFIANIILMISLSFVLAPSVFNFMSANGGENDLITFANIAKEDQVTLTAYIPSKKYSLIYYYDKPVLFHENNDIEWLRKYLDDNPYAYVVVEIKELWEVEEKKIRYMLLDSGNRYCLIQKMPDIEGYEIPEEEAEVIVY